MLLSEAFLFFGLNFRKSLQRLDFCSFSFKLKKVLGSEILNIFRSGFWAFCTSKEKKLGQAGTWCKLLQVKFKKILFDTLHFLCSGYWESKWLLFDFSWFADGILMNLNSILKDQKIQTLNLLRTKFWLMAILVLISV